MPDQAGKQSDTQNQVKIKITVDGQEKEVTVEEAKELAQKGADYTKKTQALADERKQLEAEKERVKGLEAIVDEMETNPELKTALNKTYADVKSGKISKSEAKDRNLKTLDNLIDKAKDGEERESLRDLRVIIEEEAGGEVKTLKQELKVLRDEVVLLKSTSRIGLEDKIDMDLQKLENELGKEFVSKYRKDIKSLALKYPNLSAKKLLYNVASDDGELEEALLNRAENRKKQELERKKKGSSPGGEETVTPKSKYEYDGAGKVTTQSLIARVKERLGK